MKKGNRMKKWHVTIPLGASALVIVEAETKEEAIEKAINEGVPTVCHSCYEEVELGEFYDEDKAEAVELEDE